MNFELHPIFYFSHLNNIKTSLWAHAFRTFIIIWNYYIFQSQKKKPRGVMSVWRNNFPITPLDFFVMKNYCDWKIISPHMTLITPLGFFWFNVIIFITPLASLHMLLKSSSIFLKENFFRSWCIFQSEKSIGVWWHVEHNINTFGNT